MIRAVSLLFLLISASCFGQAAAPTAVVTTRDALIARKPKPNEIVQIMGYRSAGDMGAGAFKYVPDSTNTVDEFIFEAAVGGGVWERVDKNNLNVCMAGAIGDGSDETATFQRAIDSVARFSSSKVLWVPVGTYEISDLYLREGVTLRGYGDQTVFQQNASVTLLDEAHIVNLEGQTNDVFTALTADTEEHGTNVTVASTTGISVGTTLLIWDNQFRITPPEPSGTNCNMIRVMGITGNTLEVEPPLPHSYLVASNAFVAVVTNAYQMGLRDVKLVIPPGYSGGGVHVKLAYDAKIDNVTVEGTADEPAFMVRKSSIVSIFDSTAAYGQNINVGGYAYGFACSECTHILNINRCTSRKMREDNFGGGSTAIRYTGNQNIGGFWGANFHAAGSYDGEIANNWFIDVQNIGCHVGFGSGADQGDTRIAIRDNTIVRCGQHGIQIVGPSVYGDADDYKSPTRIDVTGNRIFSPGRGPTNGTSYGILVSGAQDVLVENNKIDISGSTNIDAVIFLNLSHNLIVKGNTIYRWTNGIACYGIRWTGVTNLWVKDNYIGSTLGSGLVPDQTTNTQSIEVSLENNRVEVASPLGQDSSAYHFHNRWGTANTPRSQGLQIGNSASSFTIPININQTTNALQWVRNRNLSNGEDAYAGFAVISGAGGASDTASGTFFAASSNYTDITWSNRVGIAANTDAAGIVMTGNAATHTFKVRVGVQPWDTFYTSNSFVRVRDIGTEVTNYESAAVFQMDSITRGFLPPRMSTGQRNGITNPVAGLMIFNITTLQPEFYNGTVWTNQ